MYTNDFSLFALFTAGLAALTHAYTTPVGNTPSGNPIYRPGLNEVVPAGTPYTITWDPTTAGTVTLVLLRGPAENVVPLYPIVEKTPNTGSFVWTPAVALEPDTTHYGIQLICDGDGSYQYTTQFGISNLAYGATGSSSLPSYGSPSSSSPSSPSSSPSSPSTPSASASASAPPYYTPALVPSSSSSSSSSFNSTSSSATSTTTTVVVTTSTVTRGYVASTGAPAGGNSTVILPSNSMSVPASLRTVASSPSAGSSSTAAGGASASASSTAPLTVSTGAAGRVGVSVFGAVVGLAGAVMAL